MRQTRKSSLFLMELIIAIFFFSLSAAVCVKLFAASYRTSLESTYRDTAILQAQSMAELFRSAEGVVEEDLLTFANASEIAVGEYQGRVTAGGVDYQVSLRVTGADNMPKLIITLTPPGTEEPIVALQTKVYQQLQVGEGA